MANIESIIREINRQLTPEFEEKLRAALADKDRDWLVDQVVRLTLDRHLLEEFDRRSEQEAKARARAERLERVRRLNVDRDAVERFIADHRSLTRDQLIAEGHLRAGAPPKGAAALQLDHRTAAGEALLQLAKDMLFALLFGDAETNTMLLRDNHELLTMAVPRFKAGALDFMRASTELSAAGTWQDPNNVSSDERADNVLLEIQFGDTADELVGHGIAAALSLINNLEINEQVLYARMVNIEESTLIS